MNSKKLEGKRVSLFNIEINPFFCDDGAVMKNLCIHNDCVSYKGKIKITIKFCETLF